jgi:glycosyltransferase involved in cell wall biosynthesis
MKLAIITSRYPSKDNPYNHMFVHTRSLYFIKQKNIKLTVFIPSKIDESYIFENVKVIKTSSQNIAKDILNFDLTYLHLLNIYLNQKLSGWNIYTSIIDNNIPCAMYIHGSEAQKYGTRNFDYDFSIRETLKFFYKDFYFIPKIKKIVKAINDRKNSIFLAPSTWMIKEAEENLSIKFNNFEVIPNGIDTKMFKFYNLYENRYKLITLRPLESPKYAVDVAIEIMRYLPKEFILDIYGKGRFQKNYQDLINKYNLENRIKIVNKFIDRKDLNSFFSNYGIALMSTRMDAQGVSMCEAMSSGLLTVSSYSTAIPEFIIDMQNGILADNNNPKSIAKKIIDVVENKEKYETICKNGRESMETIDIDETMRRELDVLRKIIK